MDYTYTVYEIKNKFNGKRYIGITSQDVKTRWKRGKAYSKDSKIRKAIDKYGWDNFEHNILFSDLSKQAAEEKEIQLIAYYHTTNSSYGYNIQNGGSSVGKFTQETKNKISQHRKGITLSPETRKKMSESRKGPLHWNYGGTAKEETIVKLRQSHLGQKAWNKGKPRCEWFSIENEKYLKDRQREVVKGNKYSCKPVICIETNIIYDGVYDAYKKTKINFSNISEVCRGKRKTAGGYHWRYYKGDDDYQKSMG